MRILVPVDGSDNSMHAVEFIASRTTLLGSNPEIEILNVQLLLGADLTLLLFRPTADGN